MTATATVAAVNEKGPRLLSEGRNEPECKRLRESGLCRGLFFEATLPPPLLSLTLGRLFRLPTLEDLRGQRAQNLRCDRPRRSDSYDADAM